MRKCGLCKFVCGVFVGATLGVLFAPKKGDETREDLRNKINELLLKLKEFDVDEVSGMIEEKIKDLKKELENLDKEKVLAIAKEKAIIIKEKAEEIVNLAIDKGTPVLRDAACDVKKKAICVVKNTIARLEKDEKKIESK